MSYPLPRSRRAVIPLHAHAFHSNPGSNIPWKTSPAGRGEHPHAAAGEQSRKVRLGRCRPHAARDDYRGVEEGALRFQGRALAYLVLVPTHSSQNSDLTPPGIHPLQDEVGSLSRQLADSAAGFSASQVTPRCFVWDLPELTKAKDPSSSVCKVPRFIRGEYCVQILGGSIYMTISYPTMTDVMLQ